MGRLGSGVVSKKELPAHYFSLKPSMIFKTYDCCKLLSGFMKIIDIAKLRLNVALAGEKVVSENIIKVGSKLSVVLLICKAHNSLTFY
jgi:hypothetical protein